ncbi:uncharacterized protein CTHT_0032210 [Thermochaetoides thermophila DSM 1495]|uniref:DUF7730 domain-containing protein n=1 Tax=Chaetomium thermophilum (strain DSM 1495 / CBS 144.50 / IMI 039719) TaxID=759272 RepID=G0S4Z5_CHATD|nr:hypothetical protein CTHT_0032210 [Thermochaetoides thermophila DSM 1495]EGS21366.1 hypothetical protein CTHT_0032210 [Thermochaetoides thermophila DSM 1495]
MKFKHIFYRLQRSFRRKKGRKVSSKKNVNKSKIRLTSQESRSDAKPVKHVPIDELQRSVDSQDTSLFFTKLPIELRLKIYREVWADFLKSRLPIPGHPGTGFRLHIHSTEKAGSPFTHTRCKVQLENPGALMTAHGPDLLVFSGESQEHLPASYWSEWITKLHWGRHWACRKQNYRCLKTEAAPFLPLWLSCKRIYLEAAPAFFEETTIVFTSSPELLRFINPMNTPINPFFSHIRSLELSIFNPYDLLYLIPICYPIVMSMNPHYTEASSLSTDDTMADSLSVHAGSDASSSSPSSPSSSPHSFSSTISSPADPLLNQMGFGYEVIGDDTIIMATVARSYNAGAAMWIELTAAMRAACPALRDLVLVFGGRMPEREAVLATFGGIWEGSEEGVGSRDEILQAADVVGATVAGPSHSAVIMSTVGGQRSPAPVPGGVWVLSGKLRIDFRVEGEIYVQQGGKLVKVIGDTME